MRRWLTARSITSFAFTVVFASVIAACDTGPAPSNPVPTSGGVPQRTPLEVGTWRLLISGFKRYEFLPAANGSGPDLKPANGIFGVILLDATNLGATDATLDLASFQLTDDSGHSYTPDVQATTQYSGAKGTLVAVGQPVPAGATHQVGIVFDLPLTTNTFILHALGGTLDPGTFPAK